MGNADHFVLFSLVDSEVLEQGWPTFYIPCANFVIRFQMRHKSLVLPYE